MSWYTPVPVAADLSAELATGWTARAGGAHMLVPDGCVDVLWLSTGRIVVCGPETSGWSFELPAGTEAVGVRFRPGLAAAALGLDTPGALNRRIELADVLGDRTQRILLERMDGAASAGQRLHLLQDRIRERLRTVPPPRPVHGSARTAALVSGMLGDDPASPVAELARAAGLSERQLHRRCVSAFGYGPAVLRRILRLQRFLRMARHPAATTDLSVLAAMAGYTDQPHLNRDCRALAGVSPRVLLGLELSLDLGGATA
ncbi:helix-turn-helix domain-containing protein [Nocardiopsis composta]|uniref:AraC-like DNA-binding protein n=1 Tax=Nocardiopsis composta TaxID=157465 RepID=A0A7W8QPN2_9ACTN|nr:helix-turn-helix domain-containing protein [Nocardiopsis composta]MBB5433296.1 AraC-like DNA-binding protein [Nocardiopsis composta]